MAPSCLSGENGLSAPSRARLMAASQADAAKIGFFEAREEALQRFFRTGL